MDDLGLPFGGSSRPNLGQMAIPSPLPPRRRLSQCLPGAVSWPGTAAGTKKTQRGGENSWSYCLKYSEVISSVSENSQSWSVHRYLFHWENHGTLAFTSVEWVPYFQTNPSTHTLSRKGITTSRMMHHFAGWSWVWGNSDCNQET